MLVKTSSEIIYAAQVLANVYNSDALSFQAAISQLNDSYRDLYSNVVSSDSDYYIKDILIKPDVEGTPLPSDLLLIKSVSFISEDKQAFVPIQRAPAKQYVPNTYKVENNTFFYNGNTTRTIQIRYAPYAQTLTAPRESIEIVLDPSTIEEIGKMTKDGFHFKDSEGKELFYNFNTLATVPMTFQSQSNIYLKKKLTYNVESQEVMLGDEDISYLFVKENKKFTSIVLDSPYIVANYDDLSIYIGNGLQVPTNWNIKAASGHETEGNIFTMKTDDRTSYGVVYLDADDGKLYLSSFVPDTIMTYPTNALFHLLECILANLFLSMNGLVNEYVTGPLTAAAEAEFMQEIKQNRSSPMRITNYRSGRH